MSFEGCVRQKECKKMSKETRRQIGGFVEVQVRDEGGRDQNDTGGGAEKWSSSRYVLQLEL